MLFIELVPAISRCLVHTVLINSQIREITQPTKKTDRAQATESGERNESDIFFFHSRELNCFILKGYTCRLPFFLALKCVFCDRLLLDMTDRSPHTLTLAVNVHHPDCAPSCSDPAL